MGELYQCQFSGCDIVLKSSHGERGIGEEHREFLLVACNLQLSQKKSCFFNSFEFLAKMVLLRSKGTFTIHLRTKISTW